MVNFGLVSQAPRRLENWRVRGKTLDRWQRRPRQQRALLSGRNSRSASDAVISGFADLATDLPYGLIRLAQKEREKPSGFVEISPGPECAARLRRHHRIGTLKIKGTSKRGVTAGC